MPEISIRLEYYIMSKFFTYLTHWSLQTFKKIDFNFYYFLYWLEFNIIAIFYIKVYNVIEYKVNICLCNGLGPLGNKFLREPIDVLVRDFFSRRTASIS